MLSLVFTSMSCCIEAYKIRDANPLRNHGNDVDILPQNINLESEGKLFNNVVLS